MGGGRAVYDRIHSSFSAVELVVPRRVMGLLYSYYGAAAHRRVETAAYPPEAAFALSVLCFRCRAQARAAMIFLSCHRV